MGAILVDDASLLRFYYALPEDVVDCVVVLHCRRSAHEADRIPTARNWHKSEALMWRPFAQLGERGDGLGFEGAFLK